MVSRTEAVAALRRSQHLHALPIAAALAVGLLLAAPAEWFLRIDAIQVVQTERGKVVVVQARKVWPAGEMEISWSAQVDRIAVPDDGGTRGETVCSGEGRATIRDDSPGFLPMPLADWVGDPGCDPAAGELHIAHAHWSFRLFGLTKTGTHRSEAFAPALRPVRIGANGQRS